MEAERQGLAHPEVFADTTGAAAAAGSTANGSVKLLTAAPATAAAAGSGGSADGGSSSKEQGAAAEDAEPEGQEIDLAFPVGGWLKEGTYNLQLVVMSDCWVGADESMPVSGGGCVRVCQNAAVTLLPAWLCASVAVRLGVSGQGIDQALCVCRCFDAASCMAVCLSAWPVRLDVSCGAGNKEQSTVCSLLLPAASCMAVCASFGNTLLTGQGAHLCSQRGAARPHYQEGGCRQRQRVGWVCCAVLWLWCAMCWRHVCCMFFGVACGWGSVSMSSRHWVEAASPPPACVACGLRPCPPAARRPGD